MRRRSLVACLLVWFLLGAAVPAYANAAPMPGGDLALFMILPVAILGYRWAGAKRKEEKPRILRGIILVLLAGLSVLGWVFIFAGSVVVSYGLCKGAQAIRRGQGKRRFALGLGIIVFSLFGGADYFTSYGNVPRVRYRETWAVSQIKLLILAETTFRSQRTLDINHNGVPEYGTLEQLYQADLIGVEYLKQGQGDYRYVIVLSGDPARDEKEFFAYAMPTAYYDDSSTDMGIWVPGFSLVHHMLHHTHPRGARRTFAADETGVIREADLSGSRAVTRAEVQEWKKLGD